MMEQDHYHDLPYRSESFLDSISDLENCVFRRYIPGEFLNYLCLPEVFQVYVFEI